MAIRRKQRNQMGERIRGNRSQHGKQRLLRKITQGKNQDGIGLHKDSIEEIERKKRSIRWQGYKI